MQPLNFPEILSISLVVAWVKWVFVSIDFTDSFLIIWAEGGIYRLFTKPTVIL
jgi:hypothetical protein